MQVSQRTFKNGSLRHHLWFNREPFNPGFFREPCPYRVLQRTYTGSSNDINVRNWTSKPIRVQRGSADGGSGLQFPRPVPSALEESGPVWSAHGEREKEGEREREREREKREREREREREERERGYN